MAGRGGGLFVAEGANIDWSAGQKLSAGDYVEFSGAARKLGPGRAQADGTSRWAAVAITLMLWLAQRRIDAAERNAVCAVGRRAGAAALWSGGVTLGALVGFVTL